MNKIPKILYILLIIILTSSACKKANSHIAPVVKDGVIDLRNWDFTRDGSVSLDGNWEFYWEKLLSLEQINNREDSIKYTKVPGYWNNYKYNNKKINSFGYATYRVKILLKEGDKKLGIKIPTAPTASEYFIDNKIVHNQGKVGTNKDLSEPAYKVRLIKYKTEKNYINIVVHNSNYHHFHGGLWRPLIIGEEKIIERSNYFINIFEFFLFGSILIMGFYHLFLYILRTDYKGTLFFSIFCFIVALRILLMGERFLFSYTDLNWTLLMKFEFLTYYSSLIIFVLFIYNLFPKVTHRKVDNSLILITSMFCLIVIFTPPYFFISSLRFFNIVAFIIGIYLFFILIRAYTNKKDGALILLTGFVFLFLGALNDVLYHQHIISTTDIAPIGLFIFIFAQAGSISIQFSKAFKQVKNLSGELKIKISDLESANKKITLSENKYRLLVEGTNDIIFTLDEKWNFISANKSIQTLLNISPEKAISMNFLDIIFDDPDGKSATRNIVKDKLGQLSQEKNETYFKTNFISPISSEPREMSVTLEYIKLEGKHEILGKISRIMEDELLKYFISENQNFKIDNYLILCADISQRLTRNIGKYIPKKEIKFIQLALREMIINAIEHGNLNITFDEKEQSLLEDNYMQFISKRQRDPKYKDKKVTINYTINNEELIYIISDEGEGFEHLKFTGNKIYDINNEMITHGRGIAMTMKVFDSVEYNDEGNQVTLLKKLTK